MRGDIFTLVAILDGIEGSGFLAFCHFPTLYGNNKVQLIINYGRHFTIYFAVQ